jgi:AcrR family transcriptional regulator
MVKRRWLTRDIVVEKAAEIADEAGTPRAVTLTALAAALDVRVPSLYNHVASHDDLTQAMALYALRHLVAHLRAAAAGRTGRDALLAMALAYRRFAAAHPGIYPLTVRAPDPGEEALTAVAEELLQILLLLFASLGFHGDEALHAVRGLRALLHGFTALEDAGGHKMDLDRDDSFHRVVTVYLDGLALPRS